MPVVFEDVDSDSVGADFKLRFIDNTNWILKEEDDYLPFLDF